MKKLLLIMFFVLFLTSCSSNSNISDLEKRVQELEALNQSYKDRIVQLDTALKSVGINTPPPETKPTTETVAETQPKEVPSSINFTSVTTGEKNALKKALAYLDFTAYSKEGLLEQLKYEKFSDTEAQYGVDNCGADWMKQAVKKAESYLDFMAYSKEGLLDQLKYEKFTDTEAQYGVDNCGADWMEQAVKKAESYLEFMAYSKEALIDQLEYEGFTYAQAVYGAEQNGY